MKNERIEKVKSHIAACCPDNPCIGASLYGGIRYNETRAELVTETTRTGMVFEHVLKGEIVEIKGAIELLFTHQTH